MVRQGAAAGSRYRMLNEGQPATRGLRGNYILNDNCNFQTYRPSWEGTRTVFRPFPGKDPEDTTKWDPYRLSDEDRDLGDWIRRYDAVTNFGPEGVTFILKDPANRIADDHQNPAWMLYRAINNAVKTGQGQQCWNPLVFGGKDRGAPLSKPRDLYVMQGILMEHKSNPQVPPRGCMLEHQPVLLMLSQSAGEALINKICERDEKGNFVWPDLVNLDAGAFIQFHQAGTQSAVGGVRQMSQLSGSSAADNKRYEVEILDLYNGISPTFEGIHDVAYAHVKPWDEIIRIPTIEEQIRFICSAGFPDSAIVYALGDTFGEFIPQQVFERARANGREERPASAAANPMAAPQRVPARPPKVEVEPEAEEPVEMAQELPFEPDVEPSKPLAFDPQPGHASTARKEASLDSLAKARAKVGKMV